jgi:RNA polymerase sigma-70 factor (ECF subfamily)
MGADGDDCRRRGQEWGVGEMANETESLYRRFALRLRAYVAAHGLGQEDAKDVVQEAFLRLMTEGEHIRSAEGWLFAVARNLAIERLRKLKREARLAQDLAFRSPPSTADRAAQIEACGLYYRVVEELPEPQRTVFVLRHREGLTYREIADRLGIPENTVASRLRRARHRVTRQLRQWRLDDPPVPDYPRCRPPR